MNNKWLVFIPYGLLALAMLISAVGYWPGLAGPFLLDDWVNFEPLRALDNPGTGAAWVVENNHSGRLGRSVSMLSFVANYQLWGMDPFYFKLVNLAIHLLTALLLFLCVSRLLADSAWVSEKTPPRYIALLAASLWLLSPLLLSTVLYPVQRMAQLSSLFMLLGIYAYLRLRAELTALNAFDFVKHLRTGVWLVVLAAAGLLAALSKENGVLLLPILLVLEMFVLRGAASRELAAGMKGFCLRHWAVIVLLVGAFSALAIMLLQPHWFFSGYANRDFTLVERLLSQALIVWKYVAALFFPRAASFGVFNDDVEILSSLWQEKALLAVSSWLLVIALLFRAYRQQQQFPRLALVAGGVAWFLVGHSLESTVFPLEMYFEHRNYFPAMGLCFSLAVAAAVLFQELDQRLRPFLVVALIAYLCLNAWMLTAQSRVWQSEQGIIFNALEHHPESPRLHREAARLWLGVGELERANQHIAVAEKLQPESKSGSNLHRLYNYCVMNRAAPPELIQDTVKNFSLTKQPYTATVLDRIVTRAKQPGCPYFQYSNLLSALANWSSDYAKGFDFNQPEEAARYRNSWAIQAILMPALVEIGRADLSLQLIHTMELAGRREVLMDIVAMRAHTAMGNRSAAALRRKNIENSVDTSKTYYLPLIQRVYAEHKARFYEGQ